MTGLPMTNNEICKMYREASNKQKQIGILADLNATTKADIKNILIEGGVMSYNGKAKPQKPAEVKSEPNPILLTPPKAIIRGLLVQMGELDNQIKRIKDHLQALEADRAKYQEEYNEISAYLDAAGYTSKEYPADQTPN